MGRRSRRHCHRCNRQLRRDCGVVFLDFEDDLHQVGADVGDFGEDAAGNTQRGRAQRFADGKADEARPRLVSGDEQQNEKHDEQFDADQHHADAHAGLRAGFDKLERLAAQAANAVRELAKVLTRMPNHATP